MKMHFSKKNKIGTGISGIANRNFLNLVSYSIRYYIVYGNI